MGYTGYTYIYIYVQFQNYISLRLDPTILTKEKNLFSPELFIYNIMLFSTELTENPL